MNGSVYRRDDTRLWTYRFDIAPDPLTGKRRTRSQGGFRTKREAAAAMREAMSAGERGRLVRHNRKSVKEFLDDWHASVRPSLRASTWSNYRTYLDSYVIPIIGATALQDLTPIRLNLLYAHLLERGRVKSAGGLAPKTVRNVHVMLHRALRDAVKWDLLPRNVAEDAEPPSAPRPRPEIWTPEQLGRFIQHVSDDRFYALWLLVATTGLRRGELAGLRRSDINLVSRRISPSAPRVVVDGRAVESRTKTRSGERSLALDPDTLKAMATYIEDWETERELLGQDTPLLFVWPNGRPLHPDTVTDLFHKHCSAAGLPRIRLHDVRHSYATAALIAGVSPKVISERLGHSTVAFTLQTYTHVIPGMDADAANAVAQLILTSVASADEPSVHEIVHSAAHETDSGSEEPADPA
ncbi:MAG TPA: site-specific integrase [Marmoricola sp.]|nr:site-specific integrase [Marmoricola sp.]